MKRQLDHILNKIEIQSTGSEAQSNELAKVINSVICYFEFIIMMFRVTNRLCTADCSNAQTDALEWIDSKSR